MDDARAQAEARLLATQLGRLLHRGGYYVVRSGDLRYWADQVEAAGFWANPTFLPELNADPGQALLLFDDSARFAGTIVWRTIETDDYLERMKSGREWIPEPERAGWTRWEFDGPVLQGRLHDRGGLVVTRGAQGKRLGWFLTGLAWCAAIDDRVDAVVSHTLPKVSDSKLPWAIYGYGNFEVLPPHAYPWHPEPFSEALVWSDAESVRQEVSRRLRILRQCHAHDLRSAAVAYERYKQAPEGPGSTASAAVNERKVGPSGGSY